MNALASLAIPPGSQQPTVYDEMEVGKIAEGNIDPWEFLDAAVAADYNSSLCVGLREASPLL